MSTGSVLEIDLDEVYIQCPNCLDWVQTEYVQENRWKSTRECPDCEHCWTIDRASMIEYKIRVYCDQCEMLSINGVACHEIGCPNMGAKWEDGQWVQYMECFECGSDVKKGEVCDCMLTCEDEYEDEEEDEDEEDEDEEEEDDDEDEEDEEDEDGEEKAENEIKPGVRWGQ